MSVGHSLYQDRKIIIFILIHVEIGWGHNVVLIMCNQIGDIFSGNGRNTEDLNDSKYLAIKDNFSDADIPGLIQKVFSVLRICIYAILTAYYMIWEHLEPGLLDAQLLLKCG